MTRPPLPPLSLDVLAFSPALTDGPSFHCTRCGVNVSEPGRRCVECSKIRTTDGPGDWHDEAACTIEDPELFFPAGWGREFARQIEDAVAVCDDCPVKADCLAWALETRDRHAILGGTTPEDRELIRRREYRREYTARIKEAATALFEWVEP